MSQFSVATKGNAGTVTTVNGTTNEITSTNPGGPVVTLSIPSSFIAPGFVEATTALQAGTNLLLPATTSTLGQVFLGGNVFISSPLGSGGSPSNTFMGEGAGSLNPTLNGVQNAAFGVDALGSGLLAASSQNSAFGFSCLTSCINNNQNAGFGTNALATCTSDGNACFGFFAGASLSTGNINTYLGCRCGEDALGSGNVAAGFQAARKVNGNTCVAIGDGALFNSGGATLTGSNNISIGSGSSQSFTGSEANNIMIGSNGVAADSGVIRIGTNATHTSAFIQGISGVTVTGAAVLCSTAGQLGTVASTRKVKHDIHPMTDASTAIYDLEPVTFRYNDTPAIKSYGLIAEDVEKVMPDLVLYDTKGEAASIKYHELPAMMLNEIIKLQKRVAELEKAK